MAIDAERTMNAAKAAADKFFSEYLERSKHLSGLEMATDFLMYLTAFSAHLRDSFEKWLEVEQPEVHNEHKDLH